MLNAIEYAQKHVPVVIMMHDWMTIYKMARSNRKKTKMQTSMPVKN
jgi:hypothetical protein